MICGEVVMAEPGTDLERHGLLGLNLGSFYAQALLRSQVEAVFGVQRHDTNGHAAEIDRCSPPQTTAQKRTYAS